MKIGRAEKECAAYFEQASAWLVEHPIEMRGAVMSKSGRAAQQDADFRRFRASNPLDLDPWSTSYWYRLIGTRRHDGTLLGMLHVSSNGPDRQPYTPDDIVYPDPGH